MLLVLGLGRASLSTVWVVLVAVLGLLRRVSVMGVACTSVLPLFTCLLWLKCPCVLLCSLVVAGIVAARMFWARTLMLGVA